MPAQRRMPRLELSDELMTDVTLLGAELSRSPSSARTLLMTDSDHHFNIAHPEFSAAAHIIGRDTRAKTFRSRLGYALALLAILNCVEVMIFFFLVPPPGMGQRAFENSDGTFSKQAGNSSRREGWSLPDALPADMQPVVLTIEGLVQLGVTLLSLLLFVLRYTTRSKEFMSRWTWIPRNASDRHLAVDANEYAEIALWIVHCPVGFALLHLRLRYLNLLCVLRLYTVVQSGMDLTNLNSAMLRVLANFFGLRLTAGVWIRWALEYHKWKILVPTLLFFWSLLALCFAFAEGYSMSASMWFIVVTMTTTGYGDLYPVTASGRLVAVMAMFVGLVILAYVVSQVQHLTTRPLHEQKVLDALTLSKLRFEAKRTACRIFLHRYRMGGTGLASEARTTLLGRLRDESLKLRKTVSQISLFPSVFDMQQLALSEVRTTVRAMQQAQTAQTAKIDELANIVRMQQQSIQQLLIIVKMAHEGD